MGHCKSKRKIVQGGNISKQKSKQKKCTRAHHSFNPQKYSNKGSSIQWKLHNSTIIQLLYSSLVKVDLILNTAAPC